MMSVLAFFGEAVFGIWSLINGFANFVLGLTGFSQDEDEGTTLPNWVSWTAMTLVLVAVGVLIYAVYR